MVLVVDVCLAYLDDYSPLRAPVEDAVEASARLVDAARQDLIPMLFTRVQFQHGGAEVPAESLADGESADVEQEQIVTQKRG